MEDHGYSVLRYQIHKKSGISRQTAHQALLLLKLAQTGQKVRGNQRVGDDYCYSPVVIRLTRQTEAYLSAQYELLREDAVRPLRVAVSQVKHTPTADESAFNGSIGIYDKVR